MRVIFGPRAGWQPVRLRIYLAETAGRRTALAYEKRIIARCRKLRTFPHRGTRRDDIMPGLRLIGCERRVTIAFIVAGDRVVIEGVFYGGQDILAALSPTS